MKPRYFLALILMGVGILFSCKDAYKFENKVYFAGTEGSSSIKFTIDVTPVAFPVIVSASDQAPHDIDIQIQVQSNLVDAYNEEHGTSYKMLPEAAFSLSALTTKIDAGKASSKAIYLSITSTTTLKEGVVYLVPITITGINGDWSLLESRKTMYMVINRTIVTNACNLGTSYFNVNQYQTMSDLAALNAFTFETRVYKTSFPASTARDGARINSLMGIEEICLLRFGDVTIDTNQLQATAFGGNLTSSTRFQTNRWYHVALVYDGASLKMYIDGVMEASTAKSGTLNLTAKNPVRSDGEAFCIGRSAGNRPLNGVLSEMRVWTVARSQNEIQNSMCYVDPETEGLLSYWRFNEGTGKTITDWSKNHFNITTTGTLTWLTFNNQIKCTP